MKMKLKMENRSQKYDINRLSPRHGNRCTKYKIGLSTVVVICINPIQDGPFRGSSHISYNHETWHICTVPKENSRNI